MSVNLHGVDLNLLVILDALLEERNITRVGERVGRSQPAVSNALRRLRALLGDELLVPEGRTMRLTERAHQIREPLRKALGAVKNTLEERKDFDPATAKFRIRLFTSDYISVILLPKILERLKIEAPGADLVVSWGDRSKVTDMLSAETIDLAIGHYEDAPNEIRRREIFSEHSVVQGRPGHPAFEDGLTLDSFIAARHMSISFEGIPFGYIDQAAARAGASFRSEITMPHFIVTPFIMLKNDLLAVVGERLAAAFSEHLPLETHPAPFDIPPLRVEIIWDAAMERDPALCWFRDLVCEVAQTI